MIYPNMHEELEYYLQYLADACYQATHWVSGNTDKRVVTFDDIVHFLFDDTSLAREPEDCVGYFLRDDEEVFHVRRVVDAINVALNAQKSGFKDWEYIREPEWSAVLASAKAAYKVVSQPIPTLPARVRHLLKLINDASTDGERSARIGAMGVFEEGYRANLRNPGYFLTPEWETKMEAAKAELIDAARTR